MIDRYSTAKLSHIWSLENKYQTWLDVEIAACEAHYRLGNISEADLDVIKSKAKFDVVAIEEIEREVHHDVIAFLTNLAESIGPSSRFVHLGLTSSDVVDTAFSLQIVAAGRCLLESLTVLLADIKTQAIAHKMTPCMGRTHGVHAEPTTFGLKLMVWYAELERNIRRLEFAIEDCRVGKVSGAVGNYAHMPPALETHVCDILELTPSPASTQILQRDRHAFFLSVIGIIAGTLEKFAVEIRGLQKTEFNEVLEPFGKNQKGSSAMPHKQNPILCERITGCARTIRGYVVTALENQALWHERDISHSSAERIIFPDATTLLDYMIQIASKVISGMRVNTVQMKNNIEKSFHIFYSQKLLLALVGKGLVRESAYKMVQQIAMRAFSTQTLFDDLVLNDIEVNKYLSQAELQAIFELNTYFDHVDTIFDRVLKTK